MRTSILGYAAGLACLQIHNHSAQIPVGLVSRSRRLFYLRLCRLRRIPTLEDPNRGLLKAFVLPLRRPHLAPPGRFRSYFGSATMGFLAASWGLQLPNSSLKAFQYLLPVEDCRLLAQATAMLTSRLRVVSRSPVIIQQGSERAFLESQFHKALNASPLRFRGKGAPE